MSEQAKTCVHGTPITDYECKECTKEIYKDFKKQEKRRTKIDARVEGNSDETAAGA